MSPAAEKPRRPQTETDTQTLTNKAGHALTRQVCSQFCWINVFVAFFFFFPSSKLCFSAVTRDNGWTDGYTFFVFFFPVKLPRSFSLNTQSYQCCHSVLRETIRRFTWTKGCSQVTGGFSNNNNNKKQMQRSEKVPIHRDWHLPAHLRSQCCFPPVFICSAQHTCVTSALSALPCPQRLSTCTSTSSLV